MIKNVWYILLFGLLMFSCTELYNPDLDTGQVPIVVQGLITDSVGLSYVKLYSSTPYDVSGMYGSISNASVFVKDTTTDIGYNFYESEPGMYIPEDINFMGHPGNTYTLHVSTTDGFNYISTPQTILPRILPKSFYKETVIKTEVDDFDVGLVHTTSTEFYSLKLNFDGDDNTIPRFRFTTKQCIKYLLAIPMTPGVPGGVVICFYCWNIANGKTLNFNFEEYPTASNEVNDFPVVEFPRTYSLIVRAMDPQTLTYYIGANTEVKINERILRINQFRMNQDAFRYYKGINDMLANEGKIFDPVNVQLYSNMKCTNGDNVVLGFFETSAISTYTFIVDGNTFDTKLCPNLFPASGANGFTVNQEPDFWNLIY